LKPSTSSRPTWLILLKLVDNDTISYSAAKTVLAEMFHSGQTAAAIIDTQGLAQISDEATLLQIVNQIITAHPDQVNAYREGKTQLKGWFVGQVMKATQGKANPALVNQLLHQALS
jgi:aspartyl-tRNA(Asn)/glutamyl-tRNA(Gln) amidotransferase subunit B